MKRPNILFAHERPGVARAVRHVLDLHGMSTTEAHTAAAAMARLQQRRFEALVVDVALPDEPGYELARRAKDLAALPDRGAPFVVLVASVYRRTSYKRRPARLYGADDYVEIHHLGDMLPAKLRGLLHLPDPHLRAEQQLELEGQTHQALEAEGDSRMAEQDPDSLASLIVADMVLYNGDRIFGAADLAAAEAAVADDLAIARDLMDQVARAGGGSADEPDPIGRAFRSLMRAMGRVGATS